MSDYICPQCGQTYDIPGVCDICGIDLQPNDTEKSQDEDEEENFDAQSNEGYDDTDVADDDILGGDSDDEEDDADDDFDDE